MSQIGTSRQGMRRVPRRYSLKKIDAAVAAVLAFGRASVAEPAGLLYWAPPLSSG